MARRDDALSIFEAAEECGELPAIITATRTLTFGECAGATAKAPKRQARTRVIVAEPSVETVLAVYAALAARQPIALLHPRLAKAELARQRAEVKKCAAAKSDAIVLFTSGSTGRARGVVLSREALAASAEASAANLGWRDDDRWLCCLPLAHSGGLSVIVRCLIARKPIVLHEGDFNAAAVARLARDARVTLASFVPTQLAALTGLPKTLRAVLLGGAAAAPQLVQDAIARGIPVLQTYGLTETFGQIATARLPGDPLTLLSGVVVNAGTRATPARIRIRGPMLATRYLDGHRIAPELATADLGYTSRRQLHVLGRADDVIITGGENVHPNEVEAVLAETPGVRGACAFGISDTRWGQIVGAALAIDRRFDRQRALRRWHAALPAHARPRRLALVDALPLLPNGKIDRRAAATLDGQPVAYPGKPEARGPRPEAR